MSLSILSLSLSQESAAALSADGFKNLLPLILRFFGGDTSREVCARSRGRDNGAVSRTDVLESLGEENLQWESAISVAQCLLFTLSGRVLIVNFFFFFYFPFSRRHDENSDEFRT